MAVLVATTASAIVLDRVDRRRPARCTADCRAVPGGARGHREPRGWVVAAAGHQRWQRPHWSSASRSRLPSSSSSADARSAILATVDETAPASTMSPDTHRIPRGVGSARRVLGGLVGGLVGATFAVVVTDIIKRTLAVVSRQDPWVLVAAPLAGIAVAVLVLHGLGHGEAVQSMPADGAPPTPSACLPWRVFPLDVARADLTGDVVATAGAEERFPWRLAPVARRLRSCRRWASARRWAPRRRRPTWASPRVPGWVTAAAGCSASPGPQRWPVARQVCRR